MDHRFKSNKDWWSRLGQRQGDTVAEKAFDNYFHVRQHNMYCKTIRSLKLWFLLRCQSSKWAVMLAQRKWPQHNTDEDRRDESSSLIIRESFNWMYYVTTIKESASHRSILDSDVIKCLSPWTTWDIFTLSLSHCPQCECCLSYTSIIIPALFIRAGGSASEGMVQLFLLLFLYQQRSRTYRLFLYTHGSLI